MKYKKITIIITTKNCKDYLVAALASINEHATIVDEVILWNDGDDEQVPDDIQMKDGITLVQMNMGGTPAGLCTATNICMDLAKNQWVFLMHDDMIAGPHFDVNLLKYTEDEQTIVSNKCIEPGIIDISQQFIHMDLGKTIAEFDHVAFKKKVLEIQESPEPVAFDEISYPLLISKSLFKAVGGLDTQFNTGPLNDPDLFYRLYIMKCEHDENITFIRSPDSVLYHFSGKATRFRGDDTKLDDSWGLVEEENYFRFIRKWGESQKYKFGALINTKLRHPIKEKELGLVILIKNNIELLEQNTFKLYHNFFDEVVLVDDMSDNFEEVEKFASRYDNVKVVQHALDKNFAAQRNFGQDQLNTEWIFQLDADETFESPLIESLRYLVRTSPKNIYTIGMPRMNLIDNIQTKVYPDTQFRLNRKHVKWIGNVHEHPEIQMKNTGIVKAHIVHSKTKKDYNKQQEFYDKIKDGAGAKRYD